MLDGVDQLDPSDHNSHELTWLPLDPPLSCKFLLSGSPSSRPYTVLHERGNVPEINIQALSDTECKLLVNKFLGFFGKQLDTQQEAKVHCSSSVSCCCCWWWWRRRRRRRGKAWEREEVAVFLSNINKKQRYTALLAVCCCLLLMMMG